LKRLPVLLFLLFAVSGSARGEETIKIGAAAIQIHAGPDLPLPASNIVEWVRRSAIAVSNYFGRFPVNTLYIGIEAGGDEAISGGVTHGASRIDVQLGPYARMRDLRRDWILTHEMFHLAFPTLKERYLWMMEGLSDYLEPVARARVGQLSARNVWREFVEGLPQGLPEPDDDGLNDSTRRERIYWGGNLFWLLADVEIRHRTHNRRSVDDAIRAILREGGNGDAVWSIDRVIAAADKATGTLVLQELYNELALNRGDIHLDNLWLDLGVKYNNRVLRFDDSAPWAAIRNSITAQTLPSRPSSAAR
jgi:predicted metalloprotease with PDZ domain